MQIENIINSKFNIQTDYGFKLEILPSTIKGLFDGLSSFVDNYKFKDDGDYNLMIMLMSKIMMMMYLTN